MKRGQWRPRRVVDPVRDRVGSRRRRGYVEWAGAPVRPATGVPRLIDDAHWFPAGAPPRLQTTVDILIDGEQTFHAAWKAIQGASQAVWLVDWAMESDMELVRGRTRDTVPPAVGPQSTGYRVFDLLTAVAQQVEVRILLWRGSFLFRPRTVAARRTLRHLRSAQPLVQGRLEKHLRLAHCHHQKTIVVDGKVAFVGGLDMTDFDIDRWDTSTHVMRKGLNWHDVCLRLEGGAAVDVARNFAQRWEAVTGETLYLPAEISPLESVAGETDAVSPVQIVRTIPSRHYPFAPQGEFGVAWAYQHGLRQARHFIYLENQYLWSPAVVGELIAALRRVDDPAFRIVLVLPAQPNVGKRDTDLHVGQLLAADDGRGRVHVFTLYTTYPEARRAWTYKPIYVHAKVAVVDDLWCTVGSANLNERSLASDSEINAQILDSRVARELRIRLWSEHLGVPEDVLTSLSPCDVVDQFWVPCADQARAILESRSGALPSRAVRYRMGTMPADLALGAVEATLLDA